MTVMQVVNPYEPEDVTRYEYLLASITKPWLAPLPADCMLWPFGRDPEDYGRVWLPDGTQRFTHRVSYELTYGLVDGTLEIDHLCRVHACYNPHHLEAVTKSTNLSRGVKSRKLGQ